MQCAAAAERRAAVEHLQQKGLCFRRDIKELLAGVVGIFYIPSAFAGNDKPICHLLGESDEKSLSLFKRTVLLTDNIGLAKQFCLSVCQFFGGGVKDLGEFSHKVKLLTVVSLGYLFGLPD